MPSEGTKFSESCLEKCPKGGAQAEILPCLAVLARGHKGPSGS